MKTEKKQKNKNRQQQKTQTKMSTTTKYYVTIEKPQLIQFFFKLKTTKKL